MKIKQLLTALKEEEKLFSKMTNEKTIVFEKYNGSWTHIKKAIEHWTIKGEGSYVSLPKIQIEGSWEKITDDKVEDDKLIGLLKHMQNHEKNAEYEQKYENLDDDCLGFEKSADNKWQHVVIRSE